MMHPLRWWFRNFDLSVMHLLFQPFRRFMDRYLVTRDEVSDKRTRLSSILYTVSTTLGKSNLVFSLVFLYAVFSYYGTQAQETLILLLFWGIYVALWPLKIPHIIQALFSSGQNTEQGEIVRVDDPDLVRIRLYRNTEWSGSFAACLGDGRTRQVMPLYMQIQDEQVIGTGLLLDSIDLPNEKVKRGFAYHSMDDLPKERPVGLISENSQIAKIYFETWRSSELSEGLLIHCQVKGRTVYYQISDAATNEEAFEKHRHGFQIVEAYQLGTLKPTGGFEKFTWVPEMNTPVYLSPHDVQESPPTPTPSQMCLGTVPGSNVQVICDINELISHHTAILGVTGSGKTELAYAIIRKAITLGTKVFCVDITGHYVTRLTKLDPVELSISDKLADELGEKLHEAETGPYGAGKEKDTLKKFADKMRNDIDAGIEKFLEGENNLGIFTMPSISNTKATIYATEIYLSAIFKYGRETLNKKGKRKILVVLEEAHTVIPEASTMGLGDFDSKGMIAKIAQIALQGRKYDVGLLVIAQRTATVSKTVLTQCNTMISFASFDQTGLAFLSNIYGAEHTSRLSNLPFLHALAFGKGVKSERPVVVEIPFDPSLNPEPKEAEPKPS